MPDVFKKFDLIENEVHLQRELLKVGNKIAPGLLMAFGSMSL
jgi:hypothetical protein